MSERIRPIFATTEAKFQNAQDRLRNLFGLVPKNGKDRWFQANKEKIRNIINGGFSLSEEDVRTREEWLTEVLFSYRNFLSLEFGSYSGADVLNALGVRNKEEFYELVDEIFPEQGGTLLLLDVENAADVPYKDSRAQLIKSHMRPAGVVDDINQLITEMGESPNSQGAMQRLAALINGQEEPYSTVQTDPILLKKIKNAWSQLSEREQRIIMERIFNEKTLQEIGETIGRSTERVSQIFDAALIKLRKFSSPKIRSALPPLVEKKLSESEEEAVEEKKHLRQERMYRSNAKSNISWYLKESIDISQEHINGLSLKAPFYSPINDVCFYIYQQQAAKLVDNLSSAEVELLRKFFSKQFKIKLSKGEIDEFEARSVKYVKDTLNTVTREAKKELLGWVKSQFNPAEPENGDVNRELRIRTEEDKLKASRLQLEIINEKQMCIDLINSAEDAIISGAKEEFLNLIDKLLPVIKKIRGLRVEYLNLVSKLS